MTKVVVTWFMQQRPEVIYYLPSGSSSAMFVVALEAAYRWVQDVWYPDAADNGNAPGYVLSDPDEGQAKVLQTNKSVENNADIFRAFTTLSDITTQLGLSSEKQEWSQRAKIAGNFVMTMFDPSAGMDLCRNRSVTSMVPPSAGIQPAGPNKGNDVVNTFDSLDQQTFSTTSPRLHGSGAETETVQVTTSQVGCKWTASDSVAWEPITSGSSGTRSGSLACSVPANSSLSARPDTINIAGQTFTVTQAGTTATNCIPQAARLIDLSRSNGSWTAIGNRSLRVTQDFNWVITSTPSSNGIAWEFTGQAVVAMGDGDLLREPFEVCRFKYRRPCGSGATTWAIFAQLEANPFQLTFAIDTPV
jgi:hypothetical protein